MTENRQMVAAGTLNEAEGAEMPACAARVPLGVCQPDDIAGAVPSFASDDAAKITGQTLLVDVGTLLL